MLIAWSVVALLMTGVVPAAAQAPAPTTAVLPVALEKDARQIERMLIAPCCWLAPVSEHASPASDEVKQQIREWLGRGMTQQQVLDAFVERYGARILAEPPNKGAGRYLYVAPWLVFGLSAIGLVVLVKRLTASRAAAAPAAGTPPARSEPAPADPDRRAYEDRLDDELRDLD
jgi:cytochrome c-type biogenesis protein CcmH/NrfF